MMLPIESESAQICSTNESNVVCKYPSNMLMVVLLLSRVVWSVQTVLLPDDSDSIRTCSAVEMDVIS
jgi:hypothetical protein